MNKQALETIAQALIASGKGILAADESSGTIKKRFDSIGVASTYESRRDYREMLFRAEAAMRAHISGVILFDETLRQEARDGTSLVKIIEATGAIAGIKVDKGAQDFALHAGEKITEGLDGLRARLEEYHALGARFAKWRAVLNIDANANLPSRAALESNAHALARYAALAQEADIVPIVEPEIIMDGAHDIEACAHATHAALTALYAALAMQNVWLEGTLLKPNMVIAGSTCARQADIDTVARQTIAVFEEVVPDNVPGIVFLSGGQSDCDATAHLDAMNRLGQHPWKLSFSYGRALQAAPLKAWGGKPTNIAAAQAAFAHRARMNGLATQGKWEATLESA